MDLLPPEYKAYSMHKCPEKKHTVQQQEQKSQQYKQPQWQN